MFIVTGSIDCSPIEEEKYAIYTGIVERLRHFFVTELQLKDNGGIYDSGLPSWGSTFGADSLRQNWGFFMYMLGMSEECQHHPYSRAYSSPHFVYFADDHHPEYLKMIQVEDQKWFDVIDSVLDGLPRLPFEYRIIRHSLTKGRRPT